MPIPRAGLRTLLSRLGLLLGGLVFGLVASEVVARVISPPGGAHLTFNAPDGEPDNMVQPDGELRTALRPGFQGTLRLPGTSVELRVNQLGLRGEEIPPRGEKYRWLAIGDSFTFAAQVSEAESFVALLSDRAGVEVFNGGVDGDSTWQSSRRYLRVERDLQPDGVVLVYFLGNDPQDNERFPPQPPVANPRPAPPSARAAELKPRLHPLESFLFEHSFLFAHWRVWSRTRSLATRGAQDLQRWRGELEIFTRHGRGRREALMPKTRAAFEELAGFTSARGDQLLVALAPPVFVVDQARMAPTLELVGLDPATADPDGLGKAVIGELDRLGIASCDLTPALRASEAAGEAPYLHFDGHWSAEGHRAVAGALAGCLPARPSSSAPM